MNASKRWQRAVADLHAAGDGFVLVTVLETHGSAPRDDDSKMVVTRTGIFDTIGGGQLEYRAIDIARGLIDDGATRKTIEDFPLGPRLDQCCGGRVRILFEHFPPPAFNIELHGAGHVGRALIRILGEIDCRVRWIDERAREFPASIPENVARVDTRAAAREVEDAPAGAWHLVMTHSHPLDLEIVEAVLSRGDARYAGLIGSRSKAARFRKRLSDRGFGADELSALECPIGLPGVGGKEPMQIAVSVVADLLGRLHAARAAEDGGAPLVMIRK